MPNKIRLRLIVATEPAKGYRAFLHGDAVASRCAPDGSVCTVHELDANIGGTHSCGGSYVDTPWKSALSTQISSTTPTCRANATSRPCR